MTDLEITPPAHGKRSEIERGRDISQSINRTARALRFKSPSRRLLYQAVGLQPKLRDKLFAYIFPISFLVLFVLPVLVSAIYLWAFASNQYASISRFVVRPANAAVSADTNTRTNEIPAAKIVQDTQIVTNYLKSPAVLADLEASIDLRDVYGRADIDPFFRLDADASGVDLLTYWNSMVETSIEPTSGIVTVRAWAFDPEQAKQVLTELVSLAEAKVNALNANIWSNLLEATELEVEQAREQVEQNRLDLQRLQNAAGIVDPELEVEGLNGIMLQLRQELLALISEREILAISLSPGSAQLVTLDATIEVKQTQLDRLRAELAGEDTIDGRSLASRTREFAEVELGRKLAIQRLEDSLQDFERLSLISKIQLIYLDQFQAPTLPDQQLYPERLKILIIITLICLALWGAFAGTLVALRSKLD